MQPIRADEGVGSAIIHTEMFKDLRDQSVVLADLSLDNPNVFYELGIRHVMSNSGTVLMCRKGSSLPFDVHLSRVIFYEYDGRYLDWEEVERVIEQLQVALQQARRGEPDSPVHALLETVLREQQLPAAESGRTGYRGDKADVLIKYQKLVASCWRHGNEELENLYSGHRDTIFGARALGYYCVEQSSSPEQAKQIATHLVDAGQYDLANQIYAKFYQEGKLDYADLLRYGASYSEEHPEIHGADRALALVDEAREKIDRQFGGTEDLNSIKALASYSRRLAGLKQWRWQLTGNKGDIEAAIQHFESALQYMNRARALGGFSHPGIIAQAHLKLMLFLRIKDDNTERADVEGHREAILNTKPRPNDNPAGISYLRWFQVITLADSGAGDASRKMALTTFAEDAKIMNNPDYWEVGRRQYILLRRFLEQYSHALRHPSLLGTVSQILQIGRDDIS
jgi:hypothetical protein